MRREMIPGYGGLYSVTEDGRVFSEGRTHQFMGRWGFLVTRTLPKKELAIGTATNGYKMLVLVNENGVKKKHLVHRLVAETFLGPVVGLEVNHKDFDKANNYFSNLELCSRKHNTSHTVAGKRHGGPYGSQRLSLSDRLRVYRDSWTMKTADVANKWGICKGYVRSLVRREEDKFKETTA